MHPIRHGGMAKRYSWAILLDVREDGHTSHARTHGWIWTLIEQALPLQMHDVPTILRDRLCHQSILACEAAWFCHHCEAVVMLHQLTPAICDSTQVGVAPFHSIHFARRGAIFLLHVHPGLCQGRRTHQIIHRMC